MIDIQKDKFERPIFNLLWGKKNSITSNRIHVLAQVAGGASVDHDNGGCGGSGSGSGSRIGSSSAAYAASPSS